MRVLVLLLVLLAPRTVAGLDKDSFETIVAQASAARESGELENAVVLYERALALKPDWAEGQWLLGAVFYELTRYGDALKAFTQLLRQQPEHAGALGMRGICAFHLGQYENAASDLMRSRALGVGRTPGVAAPVRYHLGILLTRFGDFEVGHAVLTEFAAEGNESSAVIEALGVNLLRKALLPSEVPDVDKPAVRLAGRAAFAMAARRPAEAQQLLDDLVASHGDLANVHYARGVLHLADASDRAIEDFKRELAVTPSHVPARLQLAFELLRRGEIAEALAYADEAIRLQPFGFAGYLARGQVFFERGEIQRAIADYEVAVHLAPESAQAHFVLSRAYAREGRTADAERERAEFVRLEELARQKPIDARSIGAAPSSGPTAR